MALTKVSRGLLSTSIEDNGNATAITIDSSENVGIGTSSPSSILSTSGTDTTAYSSSSVGGQDSLATLKIQNLTTSANSFASIDFNTNNNRVVNRIVSSHGSTTTDGFLAFVTEGSGTPAERMRIDSSGRLGIGTTSPSSELHIASASPVLTLQDTNSTEPLLTYIDFKDSGGALHGYVGYGSGVSDWLQIVNSYDDIVMYTGASGTPSERMRIDSSGNLLVGVTSIADATSRTYGNAFSGSSAYANWTSWGSGTHTNAAFRNGTNQVGSIVTTSTSTSYNTSSDQRLKDNIADANDAGSKIDAIQVRQYDWKADGSHQDYGMIAQELQTVAPEAVTVPADSEDMMGVDYSKLVPMLIKEIQSLRNRVAQLEE